VTTIVLIAALVAAVLAAVAGALAAWRERARSDDRVAEAVSSLAAAMHETMQELAGALEEARSGSSDGHVQPPAEIGESLDLEEVARRILAQTASVAGVDAVVLRIASPGEEDEVFTDGIEEEEAARLVLPAPGDETLGAAEVAFRYRLDTVDSDASLVRSGLVIPLRADGVAVGVLGAFRKAPVSRLTQESRLSDVAVAALEQIAARSGPALRNAQRFADALAWAGVDGVTRLHNRSFFVELLHREVARSRRHHRLLSLVLLEVADGEVSDATVAEVATRAAAVVRGSDLLCRLGEGRFAAILPESEAAEAELLAARIVRSVSSRPVEGAGAVRIAAGVAELGRDDRAEDLVARAEADLERRQQGGSALRIASPG
jgi:diguanylate cyclase (GGDEF)-like protein